MGSIQCYWSIRGIKYRELSAPFWDINSWYAAGFCEILSAIFIWHQATRRKLKIIINSLRPSDAYMHRHNLGHHWFRQWLVTWSALSHYLNHCWNITNSNLRNKLQWNLKRNSCIFLNENAFENVVCEMAAILSWPQCVNGEYWKNRSLGREHCVCWWPCTISCSSNSFDSLIHCGQHEMDAIFWMPFSNAFSWMKIYEFQLRFHWSLFLTVQLTIFQLWFR